MRKIVNLANYLRFELFEIIVLKQFLKLIDLTIIRENKRFAFVTNSLEKSKKDRCKILYI